MKETMYIESLLVLVQNCTFLALFLNEINVQHDFRPLTPISNLDYYITTLKDPRNRAGQYGKGISPKEIIYYDQLHYFNYLTVIIHLWM